MFTKYINPKIQQTLRAKELALSRTENELSSIYGIPRFDDNISANAYNDITDIATRTVFFRMISNNVNNIVISGGERNEDGTMKFGLTAGGQGAYYDTKVGDESLSGIRHIAGIKNVEVAYKDKFKAIREANISWVVGSLEDLERLTPHFLTVGKTVMLDWGWVNPNQGINQQFEGQTFYQDGKIDPRLFTQSQSKILNVGGNYGAMGGVISNFDYQLRQDGGFDCNTKIIALGSSLFKKPIDKGKSDRAILGNKSIEAENSDDETEDKIDVSQSQIDSFMLAIVNLREIILEGIFSIDKFYLKDQSHDNVKLFNQMRDQANEHWISRGDFYFKSGYFDLIGNGNVAVKLYSPEVGGTDKGPDGEEIILSSAGQFFYHPGGDTTKSVIVDEPAQANSASNVIAMMNTHSIDADKIYVTWGFFEDQILNRYISYVGEDQELKMTIRSIQPTMEEGVPNFDMMESVKISNHPDLYSKDLGKYLLSGQDNMTAGDFGGKDGKVYEDMIVKGLMPEHASNRAESSKFKDPDDDTVGNIRNIFVSVQEIQKAFGVGKNSERLKATEKGHIMISDLNPPSSVEAGLKK